jgi:hypothetical protein
VSDANNPAYIVVRDSGGFYVRGPLGNPVVGHLQEGVAEILAARMSEAFEAGRTWEKRKASAHLVPGPPNPPKPYHPREAS